MQTGQRPTSHGLFINDAHLADDATTIAKVLATAGYDTGYIGKWHIGGRGRLSYIPPESRQGFDYWKVMECTHNYNRSFYYADDDKQRRLWSGYDAAAQTDDAIAYLRDHAKSAKPFALFLAWGPPHNPYEQAPPQYQKMYDAAKIELRANVPPAAATAARKDLAGYYANCTALDEYIGRLIEALKTAGIEENTILVFTSDHGDMIGSHQMAETKAMGRGPARADALALPRCPGRGRQEARQRHQLRRSNADAAGFLRRGHPQKRRRIRLQRLHARRQREPERRQRRLDLLRSPVRRMESRRGRPRVQGRTHATLYVCARSHGPLASVRQRDRPIPDEESREHTRRRRSPAKAGPRLLQKRLAAAHDDFKPADYYLAKWGYKDRVDATGTLPTKP